MAAPLGPLILQGLARWFMRQAVIDWVLPGGKESIEQSLSFVITGDDESTRIPQAELEISGKRGLSAFKYRGITPDLSFTHFEDKPRFDEVELLANRYLEAYAAGRLDRLDVAFTRFVATGHLLFSRSDGIHAVRFDPDSRTVIGPEVPVARDAFAAELRIDLSLLEADLRGRLHVRGGHERASQSEVREQSR